MGLTFLQSNANPAILKLGKILGRIKYKPNVSYVPYSVKPIN
jgi:hypothetical protein